MNPQEFREQLAAYLLKDWPLYTRLQASQGFFPNHFVIKREDEQSSSIQGAKFRKYASLAAYWQNNAIQTLSIWGSAFSNNVLGLIQLANAEKLAYSVHLLANQPKPPLKGNHLWIRLMAHANARICYWTRDEWHQQKLPDPLHQHNHLTIPEGAHMAEALPGSLTLGAEIVEQEAAYGQAFPHIFIDAGTGLTAIGLLLSLAWLGKLDKTIHITLMVGSAEKFESDLAYFRQYLTSFGLPSDSLPLPSYTFHRPPTAKAFGAVNQTVLQTIKTMAREEGLLTDPVYGAKHALSAVNIAKKQKLKGPCLFIHDGGGPALAGFQDDLAPITIPPS